MLKDPSNTLSIKGDRALKEPLRDVVEEVLLALWFMLQQLRGHHGSQREGYEGRNKNSDGECDSEFAE